MSMPPWIHHLPIFETRNSYPDSEASRWVTQDLFAHPYNPKHSFFNFFMNHNSVAYTKKEIYLL